MCKTMESTESQAEAAAAAAAEKVWALKERPTARKRAKEWAMAACC